MILLLILIFLLFLENMFLPALIGAETFLIVPLFAVVMIVYGENVRIRLAQAILFLFIDEYFSGAAIGSFVIPYLLAAGIYIWLNLFLNIGSGLRESGSLLSILGGIFTILLLVYLYSSLFILLRSSYDILSAWEEFKILVTASILQLSGWAVAFLILFKYILKKN